MKDCGRDAIPGGGRELGVLPVPGMASRDELRSHDRLGSRSLRCRSIARRCWNVIWDLGVPCRDVLAWSDAIPAGVWSSAMAWPVDLAGGDVLPARVHRAESPGRKQGTASVRRRMRAVTGSSADGLLLPDALRRGLDVVRGLERLDLFGQFGNAWRASLPGSGALPERPALSWSRKVGQFGQVSVVKEGLAQAGLVVAKLGFGNGEVLPDAVAFGAVAAGQAFQGVEDGPRPLVLPRKARTGG